VTSLNLHHRSRRLPVFFLLDTSNAMAGTFQVTMHDGLLVVKRELTQHGVASQSVYLGGIMFNDQVMSHALVPFDLFTPPLWQAHGVCHLESALESLSECLTYDLIAARADHPGDYRPLVFLILGNLPPVETSERAVGEFAQFKDNRSPLIISLVTQPELAESVRAISSYVLLLQPAEAVHMSSYFFWVARTIAKACDDYERGATTINFPDLPYGVVVSSY
jgi:uncharacterized protein YegL